MKKLLVLLLVCGYSINSYSQSAETGLLRVDASLGIYSSKEWFADIQYDYGEIWGENSALTYFVSTSFYRYKKIEVGFAFGFQSLDVKEDYYDGNSPGITENVTLNFYTLMPQLRFNWITSDDELFELYSVFGFAINLVDENHSLVQSEDRSFPLPGFQVTGFGVRFGGKLGGFFEMGLGTKGMINGGISYRM